MKRWVVLSLMSAGLLALLAACGGDDDSDAADNGAPSKESSAAARNEDEFARSMLLTISDFPTGWTETPDDDDEPNPLDTCQPAAFKEGRTGRAESGTFSRGSSAADISHTVVVYQDSIQAQKAVAAVPELAKCVAAGFNAGLANTKEAEFSKAELGTMSFPKFGDRTEAFTLKFRAKAKGQSGPFSEADGYISVVYVSNGRVAYLVQAVDVITAPDADLLETHVKKANAKVRQQPGEAPSLTSIPRTQFLVGEKAGTEAGNFITIHSYNAPVPSGNQFINPKPGTVFATIDVEACAGPNPKDGTTSVGSSDFKLQMPDNTRLEQKSAIEPQLTRTSLPPNDCVRGLVSFEVPQGVTPSFVVYERSGIIKWAVKQ